MSPFGIRTLVSPARGFFVPIRSSGNSTVVLRFGEARSEVGDLHHQARNLDGLLRDAVFDREQLALAEAERITLERLDAECEVVRVEGAHQALVADRGFAVAENGYPNRAEATDSMLARVDAKRAALAALEA